MRSMKKSVGLLLALLMLLGLLAGCTSEQAGQALQTASDIIELLDKGEDSSPEAASPTPETPSPTPETPSPTDTPEESAAPLDEDGSYTTKEDVALYLHTYGHLPSNFITKAEAQAAGWTGGSLEPYCPGKCIGGDRFGNREGLLPAAEGRSWTECDINTLGARSRGAERLVFSNDGLIYYTGDHYESFELLYP